MRVAETDIPDVKKVYCDLYEDDRGIFSEVYNRMSFAGISIDAFFVQDSQHVSYRPGTVRGLHFQLPPFAQEKLVRVVFGAIFNVAVDLRRGSPTFGEYVCIRLSGESGEQLFIPSGFAFGFCTLTANTVVLCKASHYDQSAHEAGVRWNDPDLEIAWPIEVEKAVVSPRDARLPRFRDVADDTPFTWSMDQSVGG